MTRVARAVLPAALVLAFAAGASAQVVVPFPPYRYAGQIDASVRIEVTPKNAQVFVDGYYAGIVDDFDGIFQRLHVTPGQHTITLYLDGYRTVTQRVYLMPDRTFHIKLAMEPLAAGEPAEPPPMPAAPPVPARGPLTPPRRPRSGRIPAPMPPPEAGPPPEAEPPPETAPAATGTLTLHVEPDDADVLIDGRPWPLQGQGGAAIDLSEGRHVIEVRKSGYVGYLTEVEIRGGETTPITIALRRNP